MPNLENRSIMNLEQFDKLGQNVKKSIKYILDLKAENNKLRKEVESLKNQLAITSERGTKKLNNKNDTNTVGEMIPKDKTEAIASQLDEVLKKMRNFSTGVEF